MIIGLLGPAKSGKNTAGLYLEKLGYRQYQGSSNVSDLLEFITLNYSNKFYLVLDIDDIDLLLKRPFFLLLAIDAPQSLRFKRYLSDLPNAGLNESDLKSQFMELDEASIYPKLYHQMAKAHLCVLNDFTCSEKFHGKLESLKITDDTRIRPDWDTYFMELCYLAASRSNCMKRRVGCIIAKDNRVIATGYNGTPRGVKNCNQGGCNRCNSNSACGSNLDTCLCLHAEENALLEAGRDRIHNGISILYCNTCPCIGCAKKIVQAGIKRVVYGLDYGMDDLTFALFEAANIEILKMELLPKRA